MSKDDLNRRGRVFTFVVYPDSAPENWREIIRDWQVEAYVSPLHDRDINPEDGSQKKPHYHVVLVFRGNKSLKQIQAYSDELSGVKLVKKNIVADKKLMIRYLIHYDNPEKAQYDLEGLEEFSGADKMSYFVGEKEDDTAVREMMAFCREQGITSFSKLSDYAADERPDWFRVLVSRRSYFMDKYLKSLAFELRS